MAEGTAATAPAPPAWRRVLQLLLRRFGGRLLVRGRLLNPRELLVLQLRRVDATGKIITGAAAAIRVPEQLALRVGVRGADDALERVGQNDVVALVRSPEAAVDADAADADVLLSNDTRASGWRDDDDATPLLTALGSETLFGFDVRALLQLSAARLPDESAAAANVVLAHAPAFSDLRGTRLLLRQSCGIEWLRTHWTLQSFVMETRCEQSLVTAEAHPRSYVSLGQAQKRRWAAERFDDGKELAARGRLKDAVAEFTSCLKLDEQHVAALFARGEAHAAMQQFADAIRDFEAVRALDSAFAGVEEALLRARGKQKHSRRVDLPSSALQEIAAPTVVASALSNRSRARQVDMKHDDSKPHSVSHSLAGPSGDQRKKLENDRLRRLLEAEVGEKREKRDRHRYRNSGSSDSDSDAHRHRKRKVKKKKTTKKKSKSSSKKHKRRHGDSDDHDSDSDSDSDRDGGENQESGLSSRKRKERKRGKRSSSRRRSRSNSRHRYRSDSESSDDSRESSVGSRRGGGSHRHRRHRRSSERPENRSASPVAKDEPHPILARQRHRIWN